METPCCPPPGVKQQAVLEPGQQTPVHAAAQGGALLSLRLLPDGRHPLRALDMTAVLQAFNVLKLLSRATAPDGD